MNKLKIRIYHDNKIYVNRSEKNTITIKNLGLKQYIVFCP
jgi:hypothetical protein